MEVTTTARGTTAVPVPAVGWGDVALETEGVLLAEARLGATMDRLLPDLPAEAERAVEQLRDACALLRRKRVLLLARGTTAAEGR